MQDNTKNEESIQSVIRMAEETIKIISGVNVNLEMNVESLDKTNPLDIVADILYRNWDILPSSLKEKSRKRLPVARKEVFSIIIHRHYPKVSYQKIASYLGNYHHTTAINWIQSAKDYIDTNDDYFMNLYTPIKNIFDGTNS